MNYAMVKLYNSLKMKVVLQYNFGKALWDLKTPYQRNDLTLSL